MDPALRELISKGDPGDEVEAILRLARGIAQVPRLADEISNFGDIRTIRVRRGDIIRVWSDPKVASLKAARAITFDRPANPPKDFFGTDTPLQAGPGLRRRPDGMPGGGRNVIVGIIDWGFDFAHPAFRDPKGRSRIMALWDQRSSVLPSLTASPHPYGYGQVFQRQRINQALRSAEPYNALGYHPGDADRGSGAHGTHVADIAAGSPRHNGEGGVAPLAELVFVHLAADRLAGLSDLGNSVRIIEAVDFINRMSRGRPCVINLSLGRQGGSKTGLSLVERALDAFAVSRDNACIVQSAGNYFLSGCHASGTLKPGGVRTLNWHTKRGDKTENELEIWYSDRDRLKVSLTSPDGRQTMTAALGDTRSIRGPSGVEYARMYNRAFEPNTQSHNCNLFIRRGAPHGRWQVRIEGEQIVDGRFDAWIERDAAGRRGQSRFASGDVDTTATIGSIASGFNGIAVGAAELRGGYLKPAKFGSSGPTRDGRTKPDLVAPGVRVLAARSAPSQATSEQHLNTRMSGASQASPFVAGVVALCLEAGGGHLDFHDVRKAILSTSLRPRGLRIADRLRLGAGMIDPRAAVRAARQIGLNNKTTHKEEIV